MGLGYLRLIVKGLQVRPQASYLARLVRAQGPVLTAQVYDSRSRVQIVKFHLDPEPKTPTPYLFVIGEGGVHERSEAGLARHSSTV